MATSWIISPDMFQIGALSENGAADGDFFAQVTGTSIKAPAFGGRSGLQAFHVSGRNEGPRLIFRNGAQSEIIVHIALYTVALPVQNNQIRLRFATAANATICYAMFNAGGFCVIQNASGVQVAISSEQVLTAGAWTLFEMRLLLADAAGEFEVRNEAGDVLVDASELDFGTAPVAQLQLLAGDGSLLTFDYYFSDLMVKDTTGARNNDFGPRRIYARQLTSDHPGGGWSFQARRKIEQAILRLPGDSIISVPDAAALELGSGDYTIEGFFRLSNRLNTNETQTFFGKWPSTTSNLRSFQLRRYETSGEERLTFEITTDGTEADTTAIHDIPWEPQLNRWYHIALVRASGESTLYIDGIRQGPAVPDTYVYFNSTIIFSLGGKATGDFLEGWNDEFRYTVGFARYTDEFTPPTTAFPRGASDPNWTNVQILAGWENGLVDESSAARTWSNSGDVETQTPLDGDFAYQSINRPFRDDTFIEAAYLPATATIEFVTNPSAAQEVVIEDVTYTFVSALTGANDVLIGVDEEASLDNLLNAINAGPGEGTTYGTGTTAHPDVEATPFVGTVITLSARIPGTAGNAFTLTSDVTDVVLSGATFSGGADIPAASEFNFQPPPSGVTAISSVSLMTRVALLGAGTAEFQPSIRDATGTLINGEGAVPPANPAWQMDIFDSASGDVAWSLAALLGARTHNNRTS